MTHHAFNRMPSWEKELYDAVHKDNVSTFKTILARDEVKRNGDLGRPVWYAGKAPFHEAAGCGRKRMISEMKEAGFNIDSLDVVGEAGQGFTALHLAVFNKRDSTVRLLLDLGADQSVLGNFCGCSGTPLDWAKKKGYKAISKMLERSAAQPIEGMDDMPDLQQAHGPRDEIVANNERLRRELQGEILGGIVQPEPVANPNVGECPDCFAFPDEVFSCQNCGYWVCQDCRRDVVHCSQCGQESYVKPLLRNRRLERTLRDN